MSEWICRKCGHRHSAQQWLLTAEKKCHGCGSQAVTPDNDPTYTATAPTIEEAVNETFGPETEPWTSPPPALPPEPDEGDSDEEIRKERVKLADARRREIKAKPKPKKRK